MTKEQTCKWLREHGVRAEGHRTKYRFVITAVGDEEFGSTEQVRAHLALLNKYLEVARA